MNERDGDAAALDVAAALMAVFDARPGDASAALQGLREAAAVGADQGVTLAQLGPLMDAASAAQQPLRKQRLTAMAFLARVRPGVPMDDGLADLTEAEVDELGRLLEEES